MHLTTTPASLQQQIFFSRSSNSDARISPIAQFSSLARPAHAVLSLQVLQVVEICRWPALAASTTSSLYRALPTSSHFEYDSTQCHDGAAQTQQLLLLVEARYELLPGDMRLKDQSPDAGLGCIIAESMERPISSGPV